MQRNFNLRYFNKAKLLGPPFPMHIAQFFNYLRKVVGTTLSLLTLILKVMHQLYREHKLQTILCLKFVKMFNMQGCCCYIKISPLFSTHTLKVSKIALERLRDTKNDKLLSCSLKFSKKKFDLI